LRVGAGDTVRDGVVDEYGRITGFTAFKGKKVTVIVHGEERVAGTD